MTDQHLAVANALFEVEKQLRILDLWEEEPPSSQALASTQPFAVDSLRFPQWLQFIFIPRLYQLVEHRSRLPENCGVAPMAEQYFQPMPLDTVELIALLREIDCLLSESN